MNEFATGVGVGLFFGALGLVNIDRSLTIRDFTVGEDACQVNGGLSYISFDAKDSEYHCLNGSVFFNLAKEKK